MESAQADDSLRDEIARLEERLAEAKARLRAQSQLPSPHKPVACQTALPSLSAHYLLLLSDSQLPIGSFAFSSGLESYLAHNPRRGEASFSSFLPVSISSFAATTLPFVLSAYKDPDSLVDLDDQLDAAVMCTVGRRASVAQGRALLSVWERSFRGTLPADADLPVLRHFSALLKQSGSIVNGTNEVGSDVPNLAAAAHLAPLFGVICAVVGLTLHQTAYTYMMGHVKALVSAAVRASVFGPYQAQKVMAGEQVQRLITAVVEREWHTAVEDAGQTIPVMDLWIGRHEVLYSRIFNS